MASAKRQLCMRSRARSCRRRSAYRFVRYFGEISDTGSDELLIGVMAGSRASIMAVVQYHLCHCHYLRRILMGMSMGSSINFQKGIKNGEVGGHWRIVVNLAVRSCRSFLEPQLSNHTSAHVEHFPQ